MTHAPESLRRGLLLSGLLLLAACATQPPRSVEPAAPAAPAGRYVAEPGRDASAVARMRAAPAPVEPVLEIGRNPDGDRKLLAAQGYVAIGTGYFEPALGDPHADAIRQGQVVGAERVQLYAPAADSRDREWTAVYYVRFQLSFGATFRDLRASESKTLGVAGGVAIGAVVGGTPASRANLLGGDLIVKVDGKTIAGRGAFQELLRSRAGHPVTLTLVRNGVTLRRVVNLNPAVAAPDR